MAPIQHRYRDMVYDYSTYDTTRILLQGEIRYFYNILTDITHYCRKIGDGASQIGTLPFQGIINIEASANINLEILRQAGNRVTLENVSGGNIIVNLGTTGVPINETMADNEIWEMKFDGSNWLEINKNYGPHVSVPVGAIIAWHKSLTGCPALPADFLECNGQLISDTDSPFNGQTLPDLNGDARFLRGGAVSGTEQDDAMQRITGAWSSTYLCSAAHVGTGVFTKAKIGTPAVEADNAAEGNEDTGFTFDSADSTSPNVAKTDDEETRPINMSVVWIMRIK